MDEEYEGAPRPTVPLSAADLDRAAAEELEAPAALELRNEVKAVAVPAEALLVTGLRPPPLLGGLISLGVFEDGSAAGDGDDQMDTTDMDIMDAMAS